MKGGFRYFCGWLFASFLIATGYVNRAIMKALQGEFMLSVYMHNPSKNEFESYVLWLLRNGFEILSIQDLEKIIQHNLKFPKGAAVITVDDGWASNKANIVDVANKYKVPVAIFVATSPVEEGAYWWSYVLEAKSKGIKCQSVKELKNVPEGVRLAQISKIKSRITVKREALTIGQIKTIATSEYVTIGSHTHTHPILTNCKDQQLYTELLTSKNILEAWTGQGVTSFAYPNGDYGEREMNALRASGYNIAFNSDPKPLTLKSFQNRYALPRYGILEGASFEENICRMVGLWKPLTTKFKHFFFRKENQGPDETTVKQSFNAEHQQRYKQYS